LDPAAHAEDEYCGITRATGAMYRQTEVCIQEEWGDFNSYYNLILKLNIGSSTIVEVLTYVHTNFVKGNGLSCELQKAFHRHSPYIGCD
jgi:hypothetical protein